LTERAATLVIHPGALGDVLQAVPALRALRRTGTLAFSGQPRLGHFLHGLGLADTVLPFDGLGLEALFTLAPAPASLVARLHGFSRVVSWFGSRDALYPERLRALSPECVIASPLPGDVERLNVWQHLLATTGNASCPEVRPLDVPALWRDQGNHALIELGAASGRPLLMVHPGAGARWKLWPVEHHAHVIDQVIRDTGAQALIHQGPADREVAEHLCRILDGRAVRLLEPDLPLLAAVLAQSSAFLGGDSGVSHLAAAVGAPAVILFPTATRERWAPWSPTAQALAMSVEPDRVAAVLCELMRG
jgi:lipopolysaccharide heptosyltransferase III